MASTWFRVCLAALSGRAPDLAAARQAAAGLEAVAGSSAGRARALAALLTAALQHYEAHGDGDCPVCARPGALTAESRTSRATTWERTAAWTPQPIPDTKPRPA
jgi:hypothetical protein